MDQDQEPKEGFSFLQETIKDGNGRNKSFMKIICMISVLGVVFGITAGASFVVIKPWLEAMFEDKEVVTIPADVEEDLGVDDSVSTEDVVEEALEGVKEEILQEIIDGSESTELQITDFEKIYEELYAVAQEVSKSTVTVRVEYSVAAEEELVLNVLEGDVVEEIRSVTGLIVAATSSEILILMPTSILEDAEQIYVKFNDQSEVTAILKAEETILGYGVLSVKASEVSEDGYEVAELGNSLIVQQGDVAIAIGNQFDYEDGLGYGVISSTKNQLNLVDGVYNLLSTDIPVSADGTGVLINTEGQIIGLINSQLTDETAVDAVGISQLKTMIESLSNGQDIPYIGIKSVEITEEIALQQSMPMGIYVQSVEMDSPAMSAGIRSGDIIISINGIETTTTSIYQNELQDMSQGDTIVICIQRKGYDEYVEMEIDITVGSRD